MTISERRSQSFDDEDRSVEPTLGHELGNVVLLLDAAIRLAPDSVELTRLLVDAKRRLQELSRSPEPG